MSHSTWNPVASMPWKETDSMKERVKFVLE